jgi:hypothetical protein
MKNKQDTNTVQKYFNANCKENYGEITCILLHPSKKNAKVVRNGYVFFHGCKKLLEPL